MPIGVCKLCLQTRPLQDSHYLPKGAYKINRAPPLKNASPVVLIERTIVAIVRPAKRLPALLGLRTKIQQKWRGMGAWKSSPRLR